ncbi:YggS family pyridoxal phosphate-dependent enzyme [Amphritea balenae]|uniref:Pyridoxal phosphate homeostasis protein n=1 Tax=Amphritea balenae TaxID=452629 RepID=A0A3P1SJ67_9GAMM|nr:YggS family pyridoxal phosphate-dependent enzyme [Amphritea balenae]RRC97188.1 YggS family pyridoxal phosphate-dependent enzyme [Amphritea balenae]GGK63997.1 YggS family pyridoxal phosphate enzyme [Amphritea balenae]
MTNIANNLSIICSKINIAAQNAHRNPDEVTLLAVSKTRQSEELMQLWQEGQRHFGENYLQEALDKIKLLQGNDICWHFIGPIQSNKTRSITENFSWVHSVDRLKIAQRLNDQRPDSLPPLNICLQINISEEQSKSGIIPAELPKLAEQIAAMPNIRLRGLMAIPANCEDPEQQRIPFARMQALLLQLQEQLPQQPLDTLSMGMSGDMDAAIAEGSTMVRIGTALFGPRDYSNKI